jgi:membrane protein
MELLKKSLTSQIKDLVNKIMEDDLFLLSSSVSYYSALGLAPFVLIILSVASWIGADMQEQITERVTFMFSPQVGSMVNMIFANINKGVNISSISGFIGLGVLLSTASLVFLQFRYSFDVIYGYYRADMVRSTWDIIKERIFAMVIVVGGALLLMVSFSFATFADFIFGAGATQNFMTKAIVFWANIFVYMVIFTGLHYLAPSRNPKLIEALKMSVMSSVFFIVGNVVLATYLKSIAAGSIYGAAGTLLVFLVWSYYSAFTLFLSVEVFVYLKKIGKIK